MSGNCELCWYWSKSRTNSNEKSAVEGECRVNAPTHDGFPKTYFDEWCGKFQSNVWMPERRKPSQMLKRLRIAHSARMQGKE